MKLGEILGLVFTAVLAFWLGSLWMRSKESAAEPVKKEIVEVVEEVPPVPPAPYWTVYGLPTYWPFYLSPYWYYDVPWTGPINNPTRGYRRPLYAPHGARPGYTGVAAGGFGGGGGGHGGSGGGGHGGGGK